MNHQQLLWKQQFDALQKAAVPSQKFIISINTILNNIKTQNKNKHLLLKKKTSTSTQKVLIHNHAANTLLILNKQIEAQEIEKANLQTVLNNMEKIVDKLKTQNFFIDQQLKYYKKDQNTLRNINKLVLSDANTLKRRINHYNTQIDETWSSYIRRSCKNIDQQTIEKAPSITHLVHQKKKKNKVTFPEYFIQHCQSNLGSHRQDHRSENKIGSYKSQRTMTQINYQFLSTKEPEDYILSKFELKSMLSCLFSIYCLPNVPSSLNLSKEEVSIYSKQQIINYYQSSFELDRIDQSILKGYATLRQDIQHRQQQYILLEQSKKELIQKLSVITDVEEHSERENNDSGRLLRQLYNSQVNIILLLFVNLGRLIDREIGIVRSMLKILNQQNSQFQLFNSEFMKIENIYSGNIFLNTFRSNFGAVDKFQGADRLANMMLTESEKNQNQKFKIDRVKYLIDLCMTTFLDIYHLITNAEKQLKLPCKPEDLLRKKIDTYCIQTPDYYRIDNFRIMQKFDKKYRSNIVNITTRIDRKQNSKQQTLKTQGNHRTSRFNECPKIIQRMHTQRELRTTISNDTRSRLQKTYSRVLTLSNIVKKIGRINPRTQGLQITQRLRVSK